MARVKKQLLEILSSLSSEEIEKLQAKLIEPKLDALRREKEKLQKRLKEIDRELARFSVAAKRPAPRVGRAAKGKTIAQRIKEVITCLEERGRSDLL